MGEHLKTIHQLEHYRSQSFISLEAQYEAFKRMFGCCVHEGNIETINDFIRFDSEPFILSNSNMKVLQFLVEQEWYFKQNLKECLAVLYLVIGHCHYFNINLEQAKKYYRIASNYALQYENYSLLSLAMNNYNASQIDKLPDDVFWDISKIPAIFLKLGTANDEQYLIVRFIAHIEISLKLDKVQYAENIFSKYFTDYEFKKDSRVDLQVRVLRGKIHFQKGEYELAIEILHEVLVICMEMNFNKDLVQVCYNLITKSYKMLNEESLSRKMEQYQARFQRRLETDKRYIEKYIKTFNDKEHEGDEYFTAPLPRFKLDGECLLSDIANDGYTLVLVDCKVRANGKDALNDIIYLINDKMMLEMKEFIIASTRIDNSTIGYIIRLQEQFTDTLCAKVFHKIREHYPKNDSVLEAIYFAAVNNKENGLHSYEKCLDMAYAYIYYELYK
ncbi:dehydrogenase [Solibacillus silvestris]|uniref:dehydrogenase n=1 Tax=Solibacillus silvestris TaxID=76853 RepID=UPI003F81C182